MTPPLSARAQALLDRVSQHHTTETPEKGQEGQFPGQDEASAEPAPTHKALVPQAVPRGQRRQIAAASSSDILKRVPPQNLEAEQSVLGAILLENEGLNQALEILVAEDFYRESHRDIFRAMTDLSGRGEPIDAVTLAAELKQRHQLDQVGGAAYIAELAARVPVPAHIGSYAQLVREESHKRALASTFAQLASYAYDGVGSDNLAGEAERQLKVLGNSGSPASSVIVCEGYDEAQVANQEYLKRRAIVEQLLYSETLSLAVGAKHAGKTTNVRTLCMSVVKSSDVWGRHTEQGPVIYAASGDELNTTRMELLRMGWNARTDPLRLVHIRPEVLAEPERILEQVARVAEAMAAILIILDMLFDFAPIRDEMGYAHTREAVGKIQTLADATGAHVMATHHAPKYMLLDGSAVTAALGSQGIAARFSPIILTRKYAADLYTVESTNVRDPRGLALPQTCVTLTENGWATASGPFKRWMTWKIWATRVMDLAESLEAGMTLTAASLAKQLDISRPDAQNTLYRLWQAGQLQREKRKRSMHYWVEGSADLFPENGAV